MLLLLLILSSIVAAFDLDNSVTGRPEVQCGIDTIAVTVSTLKPFKGRMYVQGESEAEGCLKSQSEGIDQLRFEIPIGGCNMRRQRTLQPRGVAFSFTLVVSFHPLFVTGSDRAFNVRCFFLESVKALNTEVDVSQLTTEILEQEFSLPQCQYEIREGHNGPPLKFAHVGQKVTHSWHCNPAVNWVYGMLIHSCFADDGRGNKFELVDEHGCSTDPSLLPQIEYDSGSVNAFTHSNIFKYADKIQLYFTCIVQLCYKHDGGCEGVTPPSCGGVGPVYPVGEIPGPVGGGAPFPEKGHKPVPSPEELPVPKIPDFIPPEVAGRIKEFIVNPVGKPRIPEEEEEKTAPILPGPPPPGGANFRPRPPFRKSFPPLKDSPLNLTEVDETPLTEISTLGIVTEVSLHGTIAPSRTTSETLWPFTEKPTTASSLFAQETQVIKATLKVFSNGQTRSEREHTTEKKTTKGRRDLKKMETDLGVDVIVLPPQAEGTSDALFPPPDGTICLSRPVSIIILACLVTVFVVVSVLTFILTRWTRKHSRKPHSMMDAFH